MNSLQHLSSHSRLASAAVTCAALLCLAILAVPAAADDRDLLRDTNHDPYVMVIFDTSGSMHWAPGCSQTDYDAGECGFLCPTSDCFTPMNGDDPYSKLRQAKEALYEVLNGVDGVNFGFASYNQDSLNAQYKHWLYEASGVGQLTLPSGTVFPEVGAEEVFGTEWSCDSGSGFAEAGCYSNSYRIADMNDPLEVRRAGRLPKLGAGPDFSGVGASALFADYFHSVSWGNNHGDTNWNGNWSEYDPGGYGAGTGNVGIRYYDGSNRFYIHEHRSVTGYPQIARRADLSGFGSATISFDWIADGRLETSDTVRVRISDGSSSPTIIRTFNGYTRKTTGSFSYDIPARFLTSGFYLQIDVYQYRGSDEYFYIDNLEINAGPPTRTIYLEDNADGTRYKFIYSPVATTPGGDPNVYGNAKFYANIEVQRCTSDSTYCSSTPLSPPVEGIVEYDLISDFSSWDNGADRTPPTDGFFTQSQAGDIDASNTCAGWDSNTDTSSDDNSSGYNLRYTNLSLPLRFDTDNDSVADLADFVEGDVIPLDWEDTHEDAIRQRLAPNLVNNSLATPDFRVATYFEDAPRSGENFLRLKDSSEKPLIADGSTPIGDSLDDFGDWYGTWKNTAEIYDENFNCRKKYVIFLTDGDETCGGAPCTETSNLRTAYGIQTYVVGFGLQGSSTLECMADQGGTGDPIYPQNKQELIDALLAIFGDIKVQSRSFASASVPTARGEAADSIFLSSFTPLPDRSIWPGRIDAFRKPLPLKADDTPDFDRECTATRQSACHLWNAGEELYDQAPTELDIENAIDAGDSAGWTSSIPSSVLNLGPDSDTRRVFYSNFQMTDAVPTRMRLFSGDSTIIEDEYDLWEALQISFTPGDTASERAARGDANEIVGFTLRQKFEETPDPADPSQMLEFDYVLGDVFHADPLLFGSPDNEAYFIDNIDNYREFAREHFWRRRMLVVASNDAQLHFFDTGHRVKAYDAQRAIYVERFTDGEGFELFSYIPRLAMPIVNKLATEDKHIFSLDNAGRLADVFIDPHHETEAADPPNPDDRIWRTVLIAGMREGGDTFRSSLAVPGFVSGYYALDLTQPDVLTDGEFEPKERKIPATVRDIPTCLVNGSSGIDSDGNQTAFGLSANSPCTITDGAGNDVAHPFPAELWSFTGEAPSQPGRLNDLAAQCWAKFGETCYMDEEDLDGNPATREGNGERDLGDTWSKPVIGRVNICTGAICDPNVEPNNIEDIHVAIVGGGLESSSPQSSRRGSWLYMINIETGEPIYKRQLTGAVPSTPAVIDVDGDAIFDVIYVGTTLGFIYKVDLRTLDSSGHVPGLTAISVDNTRVVGDPLDPADTPPTIYRVEDTAWDPLLIFDTGGRPIYMDLAVFNVPDLDQYAIAFGTGNRFNLWDLDGTTGRFFTFVDQDYTVADAGILPRIESDYPLVDPDGVDAAGDYLVQNGGWGFDLDADERVITRAFVLVGVMVFTSFQPQELVSSGVCARSGVSRVFVVDATNGDAFTNDRYETIGDFTTALYVDQTATKNPATQDSAGGSGRTSENQTDPQQEALQEAIRQSLMRFFPEGCRFNKSFSLTVNAQKADTASVRYATIPQAICPIDLKEY